MKTSLKQRGRSRHQQNTSVASDKHFIYHPPVITFLLQRNFIYLTPSKLETSQSRYHFN